MTRTTSFFGLLTGLAFSVVSPLPAQTRSVYHVRLSGTLFDKSFSLIDQAIEQGVRSGAQALVLELDVDTEDIQLSDRVAGLISASPLATYALVNATALNGGALIALACDSIYMTPDAALGGSVQASLPSFVMRDGERVPLPALFGRYTMARGLDRAVGEAMVDPAPGGHRRAFTAEAAVAAHLAAAEVATLDDLLERIPVRDPTVVDVDDAWLSTTVTVENNNWRDINVFARSSGGLRIRLGTVTSMNSANYSIPGHMLAANTAIRIVAEIIGSDDTIETETLRVVPGLVVEWRIENVLANSTYFVWTRS
ncbi:MAG TPA: hypothetical protein VJ997_04195 [Longimicrobiales bacterium]|nr:hypothetical protein [Longimicrobiales bacterium]